MLLDERLVVFGAVDAGAIWHQLEALCVTDCVIPGPDQTDRANWVCRFAEDKIVEAGAYLDSATVSYFFGPEIPH
jgi:hypothetical protein